MPSPTLLTFTVMKNEGPFILEWVAWQRLMGVDRIVVLSNDCDDGTDAILDQLDRTGLVRHLPNPTAIAPKASPLRDQPHTTGIAYARLLREWREADYVFLTDVDEFPLIRSGEATLKELLASLDWPDVLTMAETMFGTGNVIAYEDRPVVGQFTLSSSLAPGKWRSRRGFKSITRNDPRLVIRNHRPIARPAAAPELRWLDGSGRDFPTELRHVHQKGADARGMFDRVTINHYSLRSLESFLVKQARGDAVVENRVDKRYFLKRNQFATVNTEMQVHLPRLEEDIAFLKRDPALAELHAASVEAHRGKIAALRGGQLHTELLDLVGATADG